MATVIGGDDDSSQQIGRGSRRAMRVMFIWGGLAGGKGGTERVVSELASEMVARGHIVYLAFKNKGEPSYPVSERVLLVPFNTMEELRLSMGSADLDVVTVFYVDRASLVSYVEHTEAAALPLVAQECTNPDRLRFNNWSRGYLSRARSIWERELITSAAARLRLVMPNYAMSFSLFQQSQIRAMPNPCMTSSVVAHPEQSRDGRWRILLFNGFKHNKNLGDAVAAFALLARRYPDWVLRVVGKEPQWEASHAKEVARMLDEHDLWERVEIVGPVEDVEAELGAAHIHAIASLSEGCPTVVLEAMAVGLPSVGFEDCPGTNELIQHEQNGLLATADDRVVGLAQALGRLMGDPGLRRDLGARAREDAQEFEPRRVYDLWESLLTEAAEYRDDPDRLFREQYAIDPERALHARRMRHKVLEA